MVELPTDFRNRPHSFYVWSRSRRAGHLLALSVGRFIDPRFRWQTLRETHGRPSEEEAWVPVVVPAERVFPPLCRTDLRPGTPVTRATFDQMLRRESSSADRHRLERLLLLPEQLQGYLDEVESADQPRAIVVTNTDRIGELTPAEPEQLRGFTDLFSGSGISLIATAVPPPFPGRYGFDIVLRYDIDTPDDWRTGQLVVEKGLPSGAFRTGSTIAIGELPWYLECGSAVERAVR